MRLTLRTLLAWRDGLLSPDDTREIGSRVEASLTARLMAGRIDAVTAAGPGASAHGGSPGETGLESTRAPAGTVQLEGRSGRAAEPGPGRGPVLDEAELSTCNSIAEYIANRLPAERMPSFEKECLQSESLLREVAGCHRLIADIERDSGLLVPADPLDVARIQAAVQALAHRQAQAGRPHEGRVEGSGGQPVGCDGPPTAAGERGAAVASPAGDDEAVLGWRESVAGPAGGDSAAGTARAWSAAVAAMLLVAALMMALVLVIWNSQPVSPVQEAGPVEQEPRRDPGEPAAEVAAAPPHAAVAPDSPAAAPEGQRAVAEDPADPPRVAMQDVGTDENGREAAIRSPEEGGTRGQVAPAGAVAASGDSVTGPPGMQRRAAVPGGDAMAIAAAAPSGAGAPAGPERGELAVPQPAREGASPPPDADGDPSPEPSEAAVGAFSEDPVVLVRRALEPASDPGDPASDGPASDGPDSPAAQAVRSAASADWRPARGMEPIESDDELLVPGGFLPTIRVGECGLRLFPMTRIRIGHAAEDGTPSVELIEGRAVVLSTGAGEGLRVRLGGLEGLVRAAPGEVIGMEVVRRLADGVDPLVASAEGRPEAAIVESAGLRFPAGGHWRPGGAVAPDPGRVEDDDNQIAPGTGLSWSSLEPATAAVVSLEPGRHWAEEPPPIDRIERMAAAELAARVEAVLPVQRALRELSVDTRVENRLAAAEALAAMGRFEILVELLCADGAADLSATQWRSLVERAVVPALARGPEQVESLLAALEDHSPHGEAGRLYSYAVGFSDEELEQGAAEDLVAALDHPELVVRRFAAWRLEQIVRPRANERIRYRAERSPTLRADGVRWWRQQLEKGLIRRGPAGGLSRG
jgi:hypothetical protein